MAKVHAETKYIAQNLLLVAQSSSVERWGALGLVLSLRWNMGTQLGMSQLRARLAETFPREFSRQVSLYIGSFSIAPAEFLDSNMLL